MINNIEFGKRLDETLKKKKISNTEITKKLDLNKNAIGNYKNGQIPNANILYEISNFLGISMEYLLAGKEAGELTLEEQKLVEYFRNTNPTGQNLTMQAAKNNAAALPADQDHNAGVSISAIG